MDFRATDTSNLATKRIEFEHVKPVKDKQHTGMQDRKAGDSASTGTGRISEELPENGQGSEQFDDSPADHKFEWLDEAADASPDGGIMPDSGEQHILDVRV